MPALFEQKYSNSIKYTFAFILVSNYLKLIFRKKIYYTDYLTNNIKFRKKIFVILLLFMSFASLVYPQFNRGKLSEQLASIISLYDNTERVRVIIHLSDKFDIDGFMAKASADRLERDMQTTLLLEGLKYKARSTQYSLLEYL